MMRVLFVTNTFPPDYTGGAEVSLFHTCRGLMAAGVACRVLYANNRRKTAGDERYSVEGVPVRRVQFATHHIWQDVLDRRIVEVVRREIRRFRPDLVHVHNVSGASLAPFVACREEGAPVVATLHDHWLLCPNNMLYRRDGESCDPASFPPGSHGCGRCLRRYDYWADIPRRGQLFAGLTANVRCFISPSQALIAQHVAAGYAPSRFRRVRHGIEDRPIPSTQLSAEVAQACAAAQSRPTLLFAGGGVEIKGADTLLAALPGLMAGLEDVQVVVAGGGDAQTLQRFRRFAPAVQTLGPVPFRQMRALFAAADLVLLPSVWPEAYSMVIYEAFQTGTPAAGARIGAVPELIDDTRGYLFAPGDASELTAQVLAHFAKSGQARRRMRQACRRFAVQELSLAQHIAALCAVYAEAVGAEITSPETLNLEVLP